MPGIRFIARGDEGTLVALRSLVGGASEMLTVPATSSWDDILRELAGSDASRTNASGIGDPGVASCLLDERSIHLTPAVLETLCREAEGTPVLVTVPLAEFPELMVEARLVRGGTPLHAALAPAPEEGVVSREFTREDRADLLGHWFGSRRFFPSTVFIEVATACNLRCPMCPCHGEGRAQDIPGAFMDFDLYARILEEAASHDVPRGRISINPQLRGESTLHPRFADMLRMAHEHGLRVTLSTNAVLFRPDIVEAVARWSDYVFLSLDAIRPQTYARIRGGDLARVLAGIEELLSARRRLRGHEPHVYAAFVTLEENRDELDDFIAHWQSRIDGVLVYQERVAPGWYREDEALLGPRRERIPCSHVVGSCAIMVDGTLAPCCFSTDAIEPLGRLVPGTTLEDLYNAPAYRRFRALHAAHHFSESALCADCNAWGIYRPAPIHPPGWYLLRNAYSRLLIRGHHTN